MSFEIVEVKPGVIPKLEFGAEIRGLLKADKKEYEKGVNAIFEVKNNINRYISERLNLPFYNTDGINEDEAAASLITIAEILNTRLPNLLVKYKNEDISDTEFNNLLKNFLDKMNEVHELLREFIVDEADSEDADMKVLIEETSEKLKKQFGEDFELKVTPEDVKKYAKIITDSNGAEGVGRLDFARNSGVKIVKIAQPSEKTQNEKNPS